MEERQDLISRQAAIDEIEYEIEMINSALDSITLDYNARERLRQRRGEAREILNSIQQLPSAQPDPNALEQEYLKGWEDGRKNLLDAVSGTLKDFCDQCGEGKKYNGVMCGACNLDSWMSAIEEMKCTIEGKPNER